MQVSTDVVFFFSLPAQPVQYKPPSNPLSLLQLSMMWIHIMDACHGVTMGKVEQVHLIKQLGWGLDYFLDTRDT